MDGHLRSFLVNATIHSIRLFNLILDGGRNVWYICWRRSSSGLRGKLLRIGANISGS
jgi:hypothetical protein